MENAWNDRIKQMEIPPPENAWEKIALSLDESFIGHEFPQTLHQLEAALPPGAWGKIERSLAGETSPVVNMEKGSVRNLFIRYAIAACFIGLLSLAVIKFYPGTAKKGGMATVKPVVARQDNPDTGSGSKEVATDIPVLPAETDSDGRALEESKRTYARLEPGHLPNNRLSTRLYSSPVQISSSLSGETSLGKNPEILYSYRAAVNDNPLDNDVNRYLMFKDSEGRFIKISKKLTSLFCCVSGEEQDDNCHDQLKRWREKIASSSFIPSPDNFMDILDLVSSLEDSRN